MCQRVSTTDRHFLSKGGTATVAGTFCQALLTSAWESAEAITFCCQALFMKLFKVPGKVRKQIYSLLPGTFYENIKSAWPSAEENYTLLPGQVHKYGSITLNFDKKMPWVNFDKFWP